MCENLEQLELVLFATLVWLSILFVFMVAYAVELFSR